jgi:Ca-activated chloride channel family protein
MRFAQPLWLLVGLLACAFVLWRYRRFDLRQRASLAQFAAARLLDRLTSSVSIARRNAKRVLFVTGLGLIFVALARPQAGYVWEETHRKGLELLFAVDTSKSMLSEDVKPNRLTRAKLAVHDLLDKLNGDGVGLIAFAGNAFLQCPITLDYDAFRESLDAIDTNTIPRGGTDIAAAIREAQATFKTRTANEKILVLMTDGEDLEAEGIAAAKDAAKDGVKIFTVGVGTTAGELVPMGAGNGSAGFVRDDQGNLVKSHLDETTLRAIANATGGMYQPLGAQGQGLDKIYDDGLAHFTRHDLASRRAKVYLEQFHWALLAALACLAASMLIGNRRKTPAPKPIAPPARNGRRTSPRVATGALAIALLTPLAVHASPQTAEQAYRSGNFGKAEQDYAATAAKQPAKPELQFNTGSAAYKAGDYAKATDAFQKTIAASDVPVQQSAYYNLGNTQYRTGEKTEKTTPQETMKTWESAIKSYDAALQINASDADAKHNRDLVQRKLDQLKKQEQQKKDQQKQQQKQNQDKKDQKDQSGQQQKQDSKDSKGDSKNQKDQKSDAQNKQGGGKDQKDKSQSAKAGSKDKKDSDKDGKGDDKNQQAKADASKQDKDKSGKPQDKPGDQKNPASQAGQEPKQGDGKQDQAAAANQPKPEPQPGKNPSKGNAEPAHPEQPKDAGSETAAAEERREPGQMTKQEAKQLLDSLRADERRLPATSKSRGLAGARTDHPLKDW